MIHAIMNRHNCLLEVLEDKDHTIRKNICFSIFYISQRLRSYLKILLSLKTNVYNLYTLTREAP
jgi:hypothetical protein